MAYSGESLVAFGLLTAVVVLSPPRDGGPRLVVVMSAAIAVTGGALHTISRVSRSGTRASLAGSLVRGTAALAASASVLMIVSATVAALR